MLKIAPTMVLAGAAAVGAASLAVAQDNKPLTGTIKIDGSSTVAPITTAVAEEFRTQAKDVRVTVGVSGTGGGFKRFVAGETDISNASRPIKDIEREACEKNGVEFIELEVAFDGLSVVVNPKNTWCDCLTVEQLKALWQPGSTVTKWSDLNPEWPNEEIHLYGPGTDSGTFDYFTEAVVGTAKASRGDYTASEDDNTLVQGIANDKQALGYIPYAYFEPNKKRLKAVGVDVGQGPILPSRETVENSSYQPLSRPMFIYVNAKSAGKPEVKRFVEFYFTHAPTLVPEVKYVPLPKQAYELAVAQFKNGKLGTVYQGSSTIGLRIEDLLRRERKL